MPYRLDPKNGKCVQVKKNGRWKKLKCHPDKAKAKSHVSAMNINVKHKK